jgi:DNA-binding MarR family transcriptional regulator
MDKAAASQCICINLRQASQTITQFYDTALEPSGLKITQFSVLKAARYLEPVSISDLAEYLGLDRTTLGRNLRILEREKLVALGPGQDHRERAVHVTEQGQVAYRMAYPLWKQAQGKLTQGLGKEQVEILGTLLSNLESAANSR